MDPRVEFKPQTTLNPKYYECECKGKSSINLRTIQNAYDKPSKNINTIQKAYDEPSIKISTIQKAYEKN